MDITPANFPILRYPSELINLIIFHVTLPSDLLHLALTCRLLCQLIVPYHLEFRQIACVPTSEHVWTYFIDHPAQARMVRSLRLLPMNPVAKKISGPHTWPYSVPTGLWLNDEHNSEDEELPVNDKQAMVLWERKQPSWLALCCAIKQMTFLEEFAWTQNGELPEDVVSDLTSALKSSCPLLRSVTGEYSDHPWMASLGTILPHGLTLNHFSVVAYSPATLTHLSMDVVLGITTVQPETIVLALQLIGTSYPNLRSLRLCPRSIGATRLQAEDIYALLKDAHWPKLKSLELIVYINDFDEASINARPWKDICRSFFRRHPLIDSLTLSTTPPSTALLGESTNDLLSNLKTFDVHGKLSEAFVVSALPRSLQSGSETPRGLVSLSCSISSRCIAVLEGLPNLRLLAAKLEERGNDTLRAMLEVLGRTTNLERLDIEPPYTWSSQWEPQEIISLVQSGKYPPYDRPYPVLPCLTHLILRGLDTESISDLMIPVGRPGHPPGYEGAKDPEISPMTSLLKVMPNLKCLKVNREQVWVSQSLGDTGEIRISFKHVKRGEVKPFNARPGQGQARQ